MCQSYLLLFVLTVHNHLYMASLTDSTLDCVFFSARANGCECTRSLCWCLGAEHAQSVFDCGAHFKECVRVCSHCTVPVPLLLSHGGDGIAYESSTLSQGLEARAAVSSSLSKRSMLKLSSSEEVDVSNYVYEIEDSPFCIWKAYCILDCSFLPALTIIRVGDARNLCVICFGAEHAQSALEGAGWVHS